MRLALGPRKLAHIIVVLLVVSRVPHALDTLLYNKNFLMARNYALRPLSHELMSDWPDSDEATSTIDGSSSPLIENPPILDGIPFLDFDNLPSDDTYDQSFSPDNENPAPRLSDDEKVVEILRFMKGQFPRLSLRDLLTSIFSSKLGSIKNYSSMYVKGGGRIELMNLLMDNNWHRDEALSSWIMEKASQVCQREFSQLTDRASRGPHVTDTAFLRVAAEDISVGMIKSFRLPDLMARYERVTPHLQLFLREVIGKQSPAVDSESTTRNPDTVCPPTKFRGI
jgi:hypothetical protein